MFLRAWTGGGTGFPGPYRFDQSLATSRRNLGADNLPHPSKLPRYKIDPIASRLASLFGLRDDEVIAA